MVAIYREAEGFWNRLSPPEIEQQTRCYFGSIGTFKNDGTWTSIAVPNCTTGTEKDSHQGTWKLDGSKLTMISTSDTTAGDVTIIGNTMKLSIKENWNFVGTERKPYTRTMEFVRP